MFAADVGQQFCVALVRRKEFVIRTGYRYTITLGRLEYSLSVEGLANTSGAGD